MWRSRGEQFWWIRSSGALTKGLFWWAKKHGLFFSFLPVERRFLLFFFRFLAMGAVFLPFWVRKMCTLSPTCPAGPTKVFSMWIWPLLMCFWKKKLRKKSGVFGCCTFFALDFMIFNSSVFQKKSFGKIEKKLKKPLLLSLPANLQSLALSGNNLTGIPNLSSLPASLHQLNLDGNAFTGTLDLSSFYGLWSSFLC